MAQHPCSGGSVDVGVGVGALVVGALVVGAVGPGSAEVVSDCFAVADAVGDWVRSGVGGGLGVGDGVGGGCAQRAAAAFSCSTVT
jgi:hypothetical protein